jgi:predicted NBD/HSP70 family sugar kinase
LDTALHFRKEEEVLLPVMARYGGDLSREPLLEMVEDRARIRGLVMQLSDEAIGGNVRLETLHEIGERLEAHIRLEERAPLGEDVLELARKGDEAAVKVLREARTWLEVGLATFVNIFDPEVIAIGGGVSEAGDLVLEPTRRELRLRSHSPSRDSVEIREATLGAKSGMLGAAALARNEGEKYVLGRAATP